MPRSVGFQTQAEISLVRRVHKFPDGQISHATTFLRIRPCGEDRSTEVYVGAADTVADLCLGGVHVIEEEIETTVPDAQPVLQL